MFKVDEEAFYSVRDISEMIGCHEKTICKYINQGLLVGNKATGKHYWIKGIDLIRFIEGKKEVTK